MFGTCRVCGQGFWATRSDAEYCSGACRQVAYRDRQRQRLNTLSVDETRQIVELSYQYPKAAELLAKLRREHGAPAARLALSIVDVISADDYHV